MDYKKLGFKCGLEIHQELSGKKLFCSCSTDLKEQNKLFEIKRKLTVSEGELGKKDIAAEYEEARDREFIYYGYEDEACLVDTDDEPPHPINQDALKIALQVALLLKLKIPPLLNVMRKVITNGSNISGFQRTLIVGLGTSQSYIETSQGKVRIKDLYLEEDSAKIIKTEGNKVYYSLSRLGIPLLELGTEPDITTPEQALETAEKIGMILRSCEGIKRGIGSIRQDVNLSIKNSKRIELKGFQDLKSIPKVIKNEINRVQKEKDKFPHVRKVEPNLTSSFLRPLPGASRMYPETDVPNIEITKPLLDSIKIPELISDRAINFEKKYNLSPQYSIEIVKQNIPFDYYAEKYCLEPKLIAHSLIEVPKELKTRFNIKNAPKKEHYDFIFSNLVNKKIHKGAILGILQKLSQGQKPSLDQYQTVTMTELETFIKDLVNKNKGVSIGGIMGDIMKKYKEKIDGQLAIKILKKYKKP